MLTSFGGFCLHTRLWNVWRGFPLQLAHCSSKGCSFARWGSILLKCVHKSKLGFFVIKQTVFNAGNVRQPLALPEQHVWQQRS